MSEQGWHFINETTNYKKKAKIRNMYLKSTKAKVKIYWESKQQVWHKKS